MQPAGGTGGLDAHGGAAHLTNRSEQGKEPARLRGLFTFATYLVAMKPRVVVAVTARFALNVVVGQIDNLQSAGWDVHVVVGEAADARLFPHCRLHVLSMQRGVTPGADVAALRRWRSLLRDLQPDVVVAATPKASLLALVAARTVGVPHRLWWAWGLRSETSRRRSVMWAEQMTAAAATDIVAASHSLASVIAANYRASPSVLGEGAIAGVDLDAYLPSPLPTTDPVAVFIGRIARDKGVADLAVIWERVNRRVPGARLLVAGLEDPLDPPGPSWDQLRSLPGVTPLGWVEDVPRLLQAARVLLLPSAREGLPAVVLEAAACGVPAVAWDVTGSRDAIVDGVTGHLCALDRSTEFAARTVGLLTDDAHRDRLGTAARVHVARHYDRHDVELRFADHLGRLLAGDQESVVDLRSPPGVPKAGARMPPSAAAIR